MSADQRVIRVEGCELTCTDEAWAYAVDHADAIEGHWHAALQANPSYFNGPILLLHDWHVDERRWFRGRFLKTEFRAYLYWRSRGFEPAGVHDAFGSAVVRSSDGVLLLGEQGPGQVNSGFSYPPAGFIDARDVSGDTRIDIAASIGRELFEETGLAAGATLEPQTGFWIAVSGPQVAIARVHVSDLDETRLLAAVTSHVERQQHPELSRFHSVRQKDDLDRLQVPAYARLLITHLLEPKPD